MQLINLVRSFLESLIGEERAQDAIEYLLVIGGISVVVVLAVAGLNSGGFITNVIDAVETAVLDVL